MSYYTPTSSVSIQFDDDMVRVAFRRLKRREVMETLLAEGTTLEKTDKLMKFLPSVITEFSGLKIDGKEAKFEDIMEEQYFQPLIKRIVEEIMEASNLGKDAEGKSNAPQPDTLKG